MMWAKVCAAKVYRLILLSSKVMTQHIVVLLADIYIWIQEDASKKVKRTKLMLY